MKSYPLTPEGAADKLADLYALSDLALGLQAVAIAADFKSWIKHNFDLTPAQTTYVNGMNSDVTRYFGVQCSICFVHRLPIGLVYPPPPTAPGYTKWTGNENKLVVSTDGSGNKRVQGSFSFIISYEYE